DGPHHPGPGIGDAEIALGLALQFLAVVVDDDRLDAEERLRRRAGLGRNSAGQRRDEDAARLGLPPGVDDRAAVLADDPVIPEPGLGIDRLADRAEEAQRLSAGALHRALALAH